MWAGSQRPPPTCKPASGLLGGKGGIIPQPGKGGKQHPGVCRLQCRDALIPKNQAFWACSPQGYLPQRGGPRYGGSGPLSGKPLVSLGLSALLYKKRLDQWTRKHYSSQADHHQAGELVKGQNPAPCPQEAYLHLFPHPHSFWITVQDPSNTNKA